MQDQYAGDMGDFGKFLLLRPLHTTTWKPRIGVHWCRTGGGSAGDGGKISYLLTERGAKRFRSLDPVLYDALKEVVANERSIAALEASQLLPADTTYFSVRLFLREVPKTSRRIARSRWAKAAADALASCELVFFDPDNGLAPAAKTESQWDAAKFVFAADLAAYKAKQTLIIYQHLDRSGAADIQLRAKLEQLQQLRPKAHAPFAVRHHRGTARAYLVSAAASHSSPVASWRAIFAAHPLSRDFTVVNPLG